MSLVFITLAMTGMARGQENSSGHCRSWAEENQWQLATMVSITGGPMTSGTWTVAHDSISITFGDEPMMVWNPRTVGRRLALMDWVWTAEHYQTKTGVPPIAGRNAEGRVWLISQMSESDVEALSHCFAHPLDPIHGARIVTPGQAIRQALDTQLEEAP